MGAIPGDKNVSGDALGGKNGVMHWGEYNWAIIHGISLKLLALKMTSYFESNPKSLIKSVPK